MFSSNCEWYFAKKLTDLQNKQIIGLLELGLGDSEHVFDKHQVVILKKALGIDEDRFQEAFQWMSQDSDSIHSLSRSMILDASPCVLHRMTRIVGGEFDELDPPGSILLVTRKTLVSKEELEGENDEVLQNLLEAHQEVWANKSKAVDYLVENETTHKEFDVAVELCIQMTKARDEELASKHTQPTTKRLKFMSHSQLMQASTEVLTELAMLRGYDFSSKRKTTAVLLQSPGVSVKLFNSVATTVSERLRAGKRQFGSGDEEEDDGDSQQGKLDDTDASALPEFSFSAEPNLVRDSAYGKFVELLVPSELRSGMMLVTFDKNHVIGDVYQWHDRTVWLGESGLFKSPREAAWVLNSRGIAEYATALAGGRWMVTPSAKELGPKTPAAGFSLKGLGQSGESHTLTLRSPSTAFPRSLFSPDQDFRDTHLERLLSSSLNKMDTQTSSKMLDRILESIGLHNLVRGEEHSQAELLCPNFNIKSEGFWHNVKILMGTTFSKLPCFSTLELTRQTVNFVFGLGELGIQHFSNDAITTDLLLGKAMTTLGTIGFILYNVPKSSRAADVGPPSDPHFMSDLLSPWVFALSHAPREDQDTMSMFNLTRRYLNDYSFSFKLFMISELLNTFSKIINSSIGEREKIHRDVLIAKLKVAASLPSTAEFREMNSSWLSMQKHEKGVRKEESADKKAPLVKPLKPAAKPVTPVTPEGGLKKAQKQLINAVTTPTAVPVIQKDGNLCKTHLLFHHSLSPSVCGRGTSCRYSHDLSKVNKLKLDAVFALMKSPYEADKIDKLKDKTKYNSM